MEESPLKESHSFILEPNQSSANKEIEETKEDCIKLESVIAEVSIEEVHEDIQNNQEDEIMK